MKVGVARFWDKVIVSGPNDCWQWTAATDRFGRGRFKWNKRTGYAPRYCWEVVFDPIPEGLYILHTCDNPGCCNPNHLFLGTKGENNADRQAKGRGADVKGSKNPAATIDEAAAKFIKERLAEGVRMVDIARMGFPWNAVQNIKYNKAWRHV